MQEHYHHFYTHHFTPKRYHAYQADFTHRVGKLYSISTGPYFVTRTNAQKITQQILPALIKLLRSQEYQEHIYQRGWFLPVLPIEKKDFFGSADFHIDGDEIKLIELNFFIPGHFGLIELFPTLFSKHFDFELEIFAKGFETRLAHFLRERFGSAKIAIGVNHLQKSIYYFEHYKYVEKFLNQNGINAKVVYAKDAQCSSSHKPMWDNEEFDGVFNLVIPRIWEHNAEEFKNYTTLFQALPKAFFPNPWCWTIGDKRFLTTLCELKEGAYGLSDDEVSILKRISLKSTLLTQFKSVDEMRSVFGDLHTIVLKPIDNYHTQGVFINPTLEQIETVFKTKADQYIAQECFNAQTFYYEDEHAQCITPWRAQLRVEFFNGEFSNFRAYGYSDPFGFSPMMPVALV